MAFIPFLSNLKAWTFDRLPQPWSGERKSIHEFLVQNTDTKTGRLVDGDLCLPDELEFSDDQLRWMAGAKDGTIGHHVSKSEENKAAELTFAALKSVLKTPSPQNITKFYELIVADNALSYIDALLERITHDPILHDKRLRHLSIWLAKHAPDRGPVKVGVAIAGVTTTGEAEEVFFTLGRHNEFTLYAAVALSNSSKQPDKKIWSLAQSVTGWGRIQAVERLRGTRDVQIMAWLLRDGFRNDIMNEYLAYICAETGNLLLALSQDSPDEKLLTGARDIIGALIRGGPAEDVLLYPDGPEVTLRYLMLVVGRELELADYLVISEIRDFVASAACDWSKAKGEWTSEIKNEISKLASTILKKDDWHHKLQEGLRSENSMTFYTANQVAKLLDIDTWDIHFERIKNDPKGGNWWEVMQTDDYGRVRQIVDMACTLLPLNEVASGPSDALGLGAQ